ncbi:hypothetical protein [Pedobacter sp. UBA5917]|jgi:hypothetical protein|uniref:hypothetical protein n=1 Tax=Pedobacter sp. UBA5917 TaxID=1947061 RepID=UPI0025CFA14C|nr:hypothetical protein [Pedobacter sp. UBA5917]
MATTLLWITRTQIFVSGKVQINEKGIRFKLKSTSFLYRRTNFFCHWDNVIGVTEMFDNHNGGYFYKVAFKNPNFVAYFSPLKKHEKDAERFFTELQFYKESYNIPLQLPLNIKLKPSSSFD